MTITIIMTITITILIITTIIRIIIITMIRTAYFRALQWLLLPLAFDYSL